MKLRIVIEMNNGAFEGDGGGSESARILRDLANRIDGGLSEKTQLILHDVNGNAVGKAKVTR